MLTYLLNEERVTIMYDLQYLYQINSDLISKSCQSSETYHRMWFQYDPSKPADNPQWAKPRYLNFPNPDPAFSSRTRQSISSPVDTYDDQRLSTDHSFRKASVFFSTGS